MATQATGTFEVKMTPQGTPEVADGVTLGRTLIDKRFSGDLDATSKVEMLSAMTTVQGSAGYVAIERVSGILLGRAGSFVLQHSATMTRGTPDLSVIVVPDSGSGELVGLAGSMTISKADGKHSYELAYTLPESS